MTNKPKQPGEDVRDLSKPSSYSAGLLHIGKDQVRDLCHWSISLIREGTLSGSLPVRQTRWDAPPPDRFHRVIQPRHDKRLDEWTAGAKLGLIPSFVSRIAQASRL